jgi:hypothetical protein
LSNGEEIIDLSALYERPSLSLQQGCQIFPGTTYQNGKNIPNNHNIYQWATKYT